VDEECAQRHAKLLVCPLHTLMPPMTFGGYAHKHLAKLDLCFLKLIHKMCREFHEDSPDNVVLYHTRMCMLQDDGHVFEVWEGIRDDGFMGLELCVHKALQILGPIELWNLLLQIGQRIFSVNGTRVLSICFWETYLYKYTKTKQNI
jgi:hypothetical protein